MRTLRVISGPGEGQSLPVEAEVIIGREGADLTIPDARLSRHHAAVRPVEGGVVVEDLGSTNGTFVDGLRIIEPVTLTSGATLRMGLSEIALELPVPVPVEPSPAEDPHRTRLAAAAAPQAPPPPAPPPPPPVAPSPPAPAEAPQAPLPQAPVAPPPPPVAPAAPPPQAPPAPAPVPAAAPAPGAPAERRSRRSLLLLLLPVVVAIVAAAVVIPIVLIGGSGATTRELHAQVRTLPLGEPTSVQVAGVLQGEPLGRVAVIIQRRLDGSPVPGGKPAPLAAQILVMSTSGLISFNARGTLRITRTGEEVVNARGIATNGTQDFDGVKGSFRLTGGRSDPRSLYGTFTMDGTLTY